MQRKREKHYELTIHFLSNRLLEQGSANFSIKEQVVPILDWQAV